MRPAQIRIVAVASVLAVVIGVAAAFVVGRDNGAPLQAAAAAPTTSTTSAAVQDTVKGGGTTPAPKDDTTTTGKRAAKAVAVGFMRELGMRDPVAATYRATGSATAEVGLHPRAGEGGRLLDQVTTLVQLHRYSNGWVATGAKAEAIEVDEPLAFSRVRSPVTVSGLSSAYEGTVRVTVTQDRRGADRVLGKGFVNGGAAELAPFSGAIRFASPSGDAGWVIFSGDTGADTGIMSATAVRIRFVTDKADPRIYNVTTNPAPSASAQLVTLTGSGSFMVALKATDTDEVRFLLVPSGTGGRPHAKLLGVDSRQDGHDNWAISWRFPDESFHGHLLIQANGPGGTVEHQGIAVVHS